MDDLSLLDEGVLRRGEWISNVVIAGIMLCGAVCLIHLRKKRDFDVLDVKIPVSVFPVICAAYTIAHLYCAALFIMLCRQRGPAEHSWQLLTCKGPLLFAGMLPRGEWTVSALGVTGTPLYLIPLSDPTQYLFYSLCLVLYLALKWSCETAKYTPAQTHAVVWGLVAANWIIGSAWGRAASSLHAS